MGKHWQVYPDTRMQNSEKGTYIFDIKSNNSRRLIYNLLYIKCTVYFRTMPDDSGAKNFLTAVFFVCIRIKAKNINSMILKNWKIAKNELSKVFRTKTFVENEFKLRFHQIFMKVRKSQYFSSIDSP